MKPVSKPQPSKGTNKVEESARRPIGVEAAINAAKSDRKRSWEQLSREIPKSKGGEDCCKQ